MRITKDLNAFSNGSAKKAIATIITNPCFHCVCLYRLSNFFYKIKLSPISKLIWYVNRILFHADIDYRADLAGGFVLVHGLGVVIGRSVISEGPIRIYQGVTLGGNNNKSRKIDDMMIYQPLLKRNVIVYTGACVFGPVVIGENSIIKAGSIVSHDYQ